MQMRFFPAGLALLVPLLLSAQPADAQRVRADIRIGGGPLSGHIHIGPDRDYRDYRPRRLRVEYLRWRDYSHRRDWVRQFHRDARVVVIYYDRRDGFYYDRFRPGLYEIRVFERKGRFYRWDDDGFYRRGRFDGRSDDRYEGRDRRGDREDWNDRDRRDSRDRRGDRDRRGW